MVSTENKKYKVTHYNDLCYNPANLKFGVICLNKYGDAIFSPIYITFEIDEEVDVDFLGANLTRWDFINRALRFQQGTVYERMAVSPEDFLSIQCYLPSKAEQICISSFVQSLNKRIDKQEKLVEALKKYKRGLVNDVFSQRIATYSERDEWTISPFGEVVTINPKTGSLPDEFIYLDLECVNSGKICAINIIKRENAPSRAQRLLEKNDVLYQMVRPYQQNNYYYANTFPFPIVASTGYAQIKCGACDPLFVYEQISSERFAKEAMLRSTGTSYPAINAEDLGEIPFFLPSIHIQKKIGTFLSLVNQKIFKSEEKLQLLKSAKSSLLQHLFI